MICINIFGLRLLPFISYKFFHVREARYLSLVYLCINKTKRNSVFSFLFSFVRCKRAGAWWYLSWPTGDRARWSAANVLSVGESLKFDQHPSAEKTGRSKETSGNRKSDWSSPQQHGWSFMCWNLKWFITEDIRSAEDWGPEEQWAQRISTVGPEEQWGQRISTQGPRFLLEAGHRHPSTLIRVPGYLKLILNT